MRKDRPSWPVPLNSLSRYSYSLSGGKFQPPGLVGQTTRIRLTHILRKHLQLSVADWAPVEDHVVYQRPLAIRPGPITHIAVRVTTHDNFTNMRVSAWNRSVDVPASLVLITPTSVSEISIFRMAFESIT